MAGRPPVDTSVSEVFGQIASAQRQLGRQRSALVAISGIDASGKGYLSRELAQRLEVSGYRVALISVDGWLRLPHERFSAVESGSPLLYACHSI